MNAAQILADGEAMRAALAKRLDVKPTKLVPESFVGFCAWINVTLSLGQLVIAKVAYDGVQPRDLEDDERAMAREIFGDVDEVSDEIRRTFVGVCGARGGKTYLLVSLRLVWGMFVRDLSSIAPGQHPAALVVAPNEGLRQEAINYAVGALRSKPGLAATLILPKGATEDSIVSGFSVRRPDGIIVDFVAGVATRGGYGGRGRAWTDAALDECAFFQDSSHKVNDEDIYDAASARVLPGGQAIITSTPWAEAGLLYDKYEENFGHPKTALVAHAPTLMLSPLAMARDLVALETKKDPENAAREYGAMFMKGGTIVFFPAALIESCIDDILDVDTPRMPGVGDDVAAGGDLGFRSDSSALAITHLVKKGERAGQLVLAELLEKRPEPEKRLKPAATCREFRERMKAHGVQTLMADQHYIETAREVLEEAKLTVIDAPASPDEVYVRARQRMRDGIVRFARHERLIRQLKEVQGMPQPGGKMRIINPKWAKGGHGDNVSAFVLGLWQLVVDTVPMPKPAEDSKEWEEEQKKARAAHYEAERARPHWRAPGGAADRGKNAFWRRGA